MTLTFFPRMLLLCCMSAPAFAVQPSYPAPDDSRVRFIEFDPYNVATIYARIGVATLVMLDPKEEIVDMAGGDTGAWGVASNGAKNGFFLKPTAVLANANMHVITKNGNVYNIDLRLAQKKEPHYLTVWYRYPKQATAEKIAQIKKEQAEQRAHDEKEQIKNLLTIGRPVKNRHYSVQGSSAILPVDVWDDGVATYFRFAANDIPAVYIEGADGKEALVNFTGTPDDVLILQGIAAKFVLRMGNALVACIYNDAYEQRGARPTTNTVSPQIERILKQGDAK